MALKKKQINTNSDSSSPFNQSYTFIPNQSRLKLKKYTTMVILQLSDDSEQEC